MALPIGHGLVGIAIGKKTKVSSITAFVLANLPDVDYFFGLFLANGDMLAFHRSPLTHSPFFGIFVALTFWLWGKAKRKIYSATQLLGIGMVVSSHWLIDEVLPPLPYLFDLQTGRGGLFDFIFAHILSFEGFYNIIIDLVVFGMLYILVIKLIFKEKLI